jgi:hypothetical protein
MAQEIQKNKEDEGLNLKTPGPKPHPSWVYRYQLTQEERTEVINPSTFIQDLMKEILEFFFRFQLVTVFNFWFLGFVFAFLVQILYVYN